jgi:hypothetical protein
MVIVWLRGVDRKDSTMSAATRSCAALVGLAVLAAAGASWASSGAPRRCDMPIGQDETIYLPVCMPDGDVGMPPINGIAVRSFGDMQYGFRSPHGRH